MKTRSEFNLIKHIRQAKQPLPRSVLRSIGDDAAVLDASRLRSLVVSSDTLVEDTHFRRKWMCPYFLGRKSCLINVSDLAAMGADPIACLLSLTLPAELSGFYFDELLRGFLEEAEKNGLALIGGDLCRGHLLSVSVTVWGDVEKGEPVFRDGARPGDQIALIGDLGWSRSGLEWLVEHDPDLSSLEEVNQLAEVTSDQFILKALQAHFLPDVPLQESLWLRRNSMASSMIDISDGLVSDLGHLIEESGEVGAVLEEECFDLPDGIDREHFLDGGEDYSLLLTLSEVALSRLRACSYPDHLLRPRIIGHIERGDTLIKLKDYNGRHQLLESQGFDHFK